MQRIGRNHSLIYLFWKHRFAYMLLLPGCVLIILFSYVPIYGLLLAFKNYNFSKGIWGSAWAGLKYFTMFMNRSDYWDVFRNTLMISLGRIVFEFPAPILFALLLNEIRWAGYKRFVQSVMYFPFFLSWVVMYGIVHNIFSVDRGVVNSLLGLLGIAKYNFLANSGSWLAVLFGSSIWKMVGYTSILYLAAITKIDVSLYDAAVIDGANRLQRMRFITLPGIQVMILTVFILVIGNALNAGFEQIYNTMNDAVIDVADIIDTFVIREGLSRGQLSIATAVGLFKSVISLSLLLVVNMLSVRIKGVGIYS